MHRVLIVFPLLLLFSLLFCCVEAQQWSTVTVDNKGDYSVNSGLNSSGVAWGYFTDDIATDGWAKLYIESNKDYTDSEQMFGAGYLEGVLTRQRITYYKTNFMANQFKSSSSSSFSSSSAPPPPTLVQFALDNLAWSRKMAASYQKIEGEGEDSDSSYYWWHVARVLDQFDGLLAGYNQDNSDPMTLTELLLINLSGDLDDLQNVFPPTEDKEYLSRWTEWSAEELENRLAKKGRCSSIVKVTPDLSDLMIAHTTWGSYWTMQRIWKTYNFKIQNSNNSRIAFSGYPGILVSFDDYFILQDTNLVVTETTNDVVNITLYENNINVQSVMYWIRAFVASRMATTSKDWVDVFSLYNSGTYNNQWIVLDYKLFVPGTAIVNNTLWIVEQMPGAVYKEDVSHILQYGYWPSYNRPYFQQVYDAMGYTYFTSKYGDMFSYQLNPRANIFRRDQGQILTIEDMMHFMQYNSYKTDPLASGYPGSQISSRFDLKGGPTAPVSWFTFGAHGGVDSKITNAAMAARSEAMVISGPTYQDPVSCPPFTWADWPNISHVGLPEVFNFTWILVGQN